MLGRNGTDRCSRWLAVWSVHFDLPLVLPSGRAVVCVRPFGGGCFCQVLPAVGREPWLLHHRDLRDPVLHLRRIRPVEAEDCSPCLGWLLCSPVPSGPVVVDSPEPGWSARLLAPWCAVRSHWSGLHSPLRRRGGNTWLGQKQANGQTQHGSTQVHLRSGLACASDLPGPDQEKCYLSLVHEMQANLKREAGELAREHNGSSSGTSEPGPRGTLASGKARPPTPPAPKHRRGERDSVSTT